MVSLHALRTHPKFAPLFADVYVVCWPILWWQLNRLLAFCRREDIADVLYTLSPWGFITVNFHSDRPDPAAYKPPARTFRPLTAPGWGSDLPANLDSIATLETLTTIPLLPRAAGDFRGKESGTVFANTS